MKKILIISEPFYPQVAAIGQLLTDLSEDLVKAGFQVKVVTGNPNDIFNKNNRIPRKENYRGIEIIRLKNTTFSKYRMAGRVLNYLTFHFLVYFNVLFCERPDLVFVLSTPPFISFSGLMLKIFKGSKVIYNVQDLFPDLAVELGKLKNRQFIEFLKKLSESIVKKVDRVVVVGEYMERKIRKELFRETSESTSVGASASTNNHIITIHNWADGDKIKVLEDKEAENNYLKKKWELEGKFVVLYSGNIGYLHEFDTVIAAAESLAKGGPREIIFVFIGEGIKKSYIEEKVRGKELNNVLFFPYQPREMLTYSLGLADVSLVTLEKGFEGMVVPSKIYGILASGRPVIAVVGGESEIVEIIREGKCGRVIKIGDYQALVDSIMDYYKDRKKCRADGLNGRRYFEEKFDRKIATRKYISIIKDVLKS
ncbi:glycosyltransferase WbuB [Candidatus Atribacteria bacterium 1244-E10-H5-B2]|nr:MAG: glycosyltransferase WbuB [Candidatus Atribacteria bacterium 1244-E10-H5-B2]